MSIIEKSNKFEIQDKNLNPEIIKVKVIVKAIDELDYLRTELKRLEEVKQQNIKLALKMKEYKDKYQQEKIEHNETRKNMNQYYQAERELNIKDVYCPFLKKEITLLNCQQSVSFGYCNVGYSCHYRISCILKHFNIPYDYI